MEFPKFLSRNNENSESDFSSMENSAAFELEDLVSWKGEEGWQIIDATSANSSLVEIAKFKANKLGEMVYAREIVDKGELAKMRVLES